MQDTRTNAKNARCPFCPPPLPPNYGAMRKSVEDAMWRLMPGWFEMLNETMDPNGPDPDVSAVTKAALDNPGKPLDDVIHEYFKDDWFSSHGDGEDW